MWPISSSRSSLTYSGSEFIAALGKAPLINEPGTVWTTESRSTSSSLRRSAASRSVPLGRPCCTGRQRRGFWLGRRLRHVLLGRPRRGSCGSLYGRRAGLHWPSPRSVDQEPSFGIDHRLMLDRNGRSSWKIGRSYLTGPRSPTRFIRGIANWAIFLNHMPENAVNWTTNRNYGFSDAADLFVFISGYTASLVYPRMMLDHGFMLCSSSR